MAVHAAGALVWRERGRALEVLLIHRPSYDDWSWPKGKPRKKETLPACAIREVKEETGVEVRLGVPLPTVKYSLSNGKRKTNWYWAAQPTSDAPAVRARPEVDPAPASEVDEAVWVDAVTALKMLTRRSDREPLKALLDLYADDRLRTWSVLITRHGAAKKRTAWAGGEATRPLTPTGVKQADSLITLFAAYGARAVLTSPWARCAQTVQPYADAARVPMETHPCLSEEGAHAEPKDVRRLLLATFDVGQDVVVCTHRPVLPTVLEAARRCAPYRVQEGFPEEDPYLRTGEALILHLAPRPGKRSRIIAVETHRARR